MDRYEWLLLLHMLSAFALVASVVVFATLTVAGRRADTGAPVLQLSWLGSRLWDVGGLGTLVFGVWLAIDLDGYGILDGWIVAALVLWVIAAGAGARVGMIYSEARAGGGDPGVLREKRATALYAVMTLATVALLADMIWKPGA